jgi:hypothetical protein
MGWFRKLRATLRPRGLDSALDDELRFHLEQRTEDFIAQGMGPEEARREALRLFGNRTALRESTRERDMLVWLETTVQDVRYALRGMRRRPGFASAAVLSLALGIGANTALFSLLDALLLKSAPVENPRGLVKIREGDTFGFSHRAFEELQTRVRSFAGVTATEPVFGEVNITERGEPRTAFLQVAAGSYFDVQGVPAWQGRVFHQAAVNSPDGAIAVISEQYWRSHYGASPAALGAHFQFLDKDFTVVGIAPPGFRGMFLDFPADVWVPLEQMPKHDPAYLERARALLVLARLRPGVTAARAAAEVGGVLGKKITVAPGGNGYSMLRTTYADCAGRLAAGSPLDGGARSAGVAGAWRGGGFAVRIGGRPVWRYHVVWFAPRRRAEHGCHGAYDDRRRRGGGTHSDRARRPRRPHDCSPLRLKNLLKNLLDSRRRKDENPPVEEV